ncbi:Phosphotransferase enzyme family protein [Streptomyces zhaozhouensis]|uniref:Phosphotransferase enzyme family protein n=1 Tax=Streptomyces zhaozhouensis TaxID=1300267 RepID=A0A286DU82_9ACTN|nr:aminoglycoside phosphotransferase family protein [Streptomyces zhaozhouensis]SOD62227.1 Phosphotransferase enzyme family protein [Streptomyces zhaozhouensis]
MGDDQVLQDDPHREVVRVGDTVRRPTYPWTPAVHALLGHLEAVGFPYSPRVRGIDARGREVLTYLEGESGPQGWAGVVDETGLVALARLLRRYHEAVADFRLPEGLSWCTGEDGPHAGEVVCHGDFGPWNIVWHGARPVGVLDWDHARPAPALHDVAYALEYVAPFRDDAECTRWLRHPEPPDRRRRLEMFATAYGLTSADGLVDAVIEVQRETRARVLRLAERGDQPQARWVAEGHLAALDERIAWSRAHRDLFA